MTLRRTHENSSQHFLVSSLTLSTASPGKCEAVTYSVLPDWKNKASEVERHQVWHEQEIQRMRLQLLYFNMVSKQHFSSHLNHVSSVLVCKYKK